MKPSATSDPKCNAVWSRLLKEAPWFVDSMSLMGIGRKASRSFSKPAIAGEVMGFTPSSSRMCSSELAWSSWEISSELCENELITVPIDTKAAMENIRLTIQK